MSAKKGEMPPAYERRLERAINQIRLGLYCEAVESASYGIELLMQALFDELKKANRDNRRKTSKLSKAYNQYINHPKEKIALGRWVDFYGKEKIFRRLERECRYKFTYFNPTTLRAILKLHNDCVHEDYQPPKAEAELVCNHLKMFLAETDRAPQEIIQDNNHWTSDWRQKWDGRIERWRERNKDLQEADMLGALVDQLVLVVDLIDNKWVPGEIKTQLMQVVIYVIDPDDFISEGYMNVHGLIDDAAVLALTLYWLDNNGIIAPEILREHWVGKEDPIKVTNDLYQSFLENHKILFSDEVWSVISSIAEKGPRVLWQMPK